jgi:hypothetical protein
VRQAREDRFDRAGGCISSDLTGDPSFPFMNRPTTPSLTVPLVVAFLALGTVHRADAQMTYTAGDIILGFQAASGDGSSLTYVYNLGAGTGFRDGTTTGLIATIATDLNNTFGLGWYERPELYWGIAGVRDPAGAGPNIVVNGDPRATIYVSRIAPTPGTSTQWMLGSGPVVISCATSIASMQFGFNTTNGSDTITPENQRTPTPTSNGRGTVQGTGDINNWSVFNPINGSAFGNILTGGVQAPLGTGTPQAYLDLYRIMGRSSDLATPNTPLGQGLLVGTFSINAAGEINFSTPSTGTGYEAWADSFGLTGADRAINADPEHDGLENGVEFVVGGHPTQNNDAGKLPTLTRGAGFVDFVFRRTDASASMNPRAEHDTDLIAPWTPAVNGTAGVTITEDNDAFGAGVDRVTVRIPSSGPVQFARLAVSQ